MKKVLFVATVTGHIIGFHIPYLKWFKEHGYEVHVASNGNRLIEYCDKHYNILFERNPLKKEHIRAYKELKKIIEENKYDIIHCHTPVGGALTRLAAKKARQNGTRVIYTAHGFHFYKGAPKINWIIYYPIEKIMAKYTDCLITINQEDYNIAKNKFYAKDIKFVNGVGVDENKFNVQMTEEEKQILRQQLGLKKDDFVIIYVAELSKRKNQEMILKAIARMKYENVKLLLAGKDSLNGMYQNMAKELKIEEQVNFLGFRKDIPQLMTVSDLVISTSKQEGLPVNLIEAMMNGKPIIATNCRGNRDVANELVEIDDIEGLCCKIKECIKNKEKFICKKRDEYKLENVLKEMEKIYNNEK